MGGNLPPESVATLDRNTQVIEAMERDPEADRAEFMAEFRSDLETFLLREVVDAATSDEGGNFFGGHAMQKETRLRTISGMSKLWDSGEGDRNRVGDGNLSFSGRRLTAHFMIQPKVADEILSDELLVGQDWLARNLVAFPDSLASTRSMAGLRCFRGRYGPTD